MVSDELSEDLELVSDLKRVVSDHLPEGLRPLAASKEPVLPRYRITGRIGEGGMGIVYEAEQESPRRTVALKVLRPGVASKRMLRRFEYEAEILGHLDHPGIAKVFEAGTYDTGHGAQPWFAMELVRGQVLSTWVAGHGPARRARLELFLAICDAVHHAHQKGVIHRDLKPTNILVDAEGRPKVLDFGVARAADADAGTTTLMTIAGQIVGTLPYMSPEQVGGDPEAVDIRSDVYALGVILHELLVDRPPLDLSGLSLAEAVCAIQQDEPKRLGLLAPELKGDLETITAKALAKERERRYDSAAALAQDVARHLRYEPISARPPSGLYQLGRFARRNRTLVGGIGAVFLALLLGMLGTWRQSVRAQAAESDARDALDQAEIEAHRAKIAADFLQSVIEQAAPDQEEPTIRDVLEEAARRVRPELYDEPVVEAEVRVSLGRAYTGLHDFGKARENMERALELRERELGPEHREVGAVLISLTRLANAMGDFAAAVDYAERALPILERAVEEPLYLRQLGLLHIRRAEGLSGRSRYEEAAEAGRRALDLFVEHGGEDNPDVAAVLVELAKVRHALDDLPGAEEHLRGAVDVNRRTLGERHTVTASTLYMLAMNRLWQGDPDEAEELVLEALAIQREKRGDAHASTGISIGGLGEIARQRGDLEGAERRMRESLGILRDDLGDGHPYTARAAVDLAEVLFGLEHHGEAEELAREVLAAYDERPDRDGPVVMDALALLGRVLAATDREEEAEARLREALDVALRVYPEDNGRVLRVRERLVAFYETDGQGELADRFR